MSSIDKGIEQMSEVRNSNIQVSHRGNMIVGTMNGEVVFTIADRYGYLSQSEREAIANDIEGYKRRKRLERERYEEQLRRERERQLEEERRRREEERQNAIANARNTISYKKNQVTQAKANDLTTIERVKANANALMNQYKNVARSNQILDISYMEQKINALLNEVTKEINAVNTHYNEILSRINALESSITSSIDTQSANSINANANKIKTNVKFNQTSNYDVNSLVKELNTLNNVCSELTKLIKSVNSFKSMDGKAGLIANELLSKVNSTKIQSINDVDNLLTILTNGLNELEMEVKLSSYGKNDSIINELTGVIEACKTIKVLLDESTYNAKDYRGEIVENANELIDELNTVFEKEQTTINISRINEMITRLKYILSSDLSNEETKDEIEKLKHELKSILQQDEINVVYLNEYNEYKEKILSYGVSEQDIPAFNADNYQMIKEQLKQQLHEAKRVAQKNLLYTTYLHTTMIMEEMGFTVFARSGDDEYITETLFTRPGYDGVLWQIVVLSDGSFTRRIIGVNKGDTQTNDEYIVQVAKEMEEINDPVLFLQKFKEATGIEIKVTDAVDHDSENVLEIIRQHGYHYLTPEGLALYNQLVKIEQEKKENVQETANYGLNRQVAVNNQNRVQNTTRGLQEARRRSIDISNED